MDTMSTYSCFLCNKVYKTVRGLERHQLIKNHQKVSKPFAITTLVMIDPLFAHGATVLAHSVRQHCDMTKIDLVCMVTEDIPESYRDLLGLIYDHVIVVPKIEVKVIDWGSKKQQMVYGPWIQYGPTKWNCLNFVQYQKVMFMDSDVIVNHDITHLFDLQAPAGTFSNPWTRPYNPNGLMPVFGTLKTGDRVSNAGIDQVLTCSNRPMRQQVVIGTTVVLEPSHDVFETMMNLITKVNVSKTPAFTRCLSGADEQILVMAYREYKDVSWTAIDQRYNFILRHTEWFVDFEEADRIPFVIHYHGSKPWKLSRTEYPDLVAWWKVRDSMEKKYPQLKI
jgi:glycogenin glucosyltransferase